MKRQSLHMILVLGLGGLQLVPIAWAEEPASQRKAFEQNQAMEWVTTLFKSFCQRDPDPASLHAYITAVQEGRQTTAQVHEAISKSCSQKQAFEPCGHVSDMKDFCGGSTSN